jgi:hypothetical protein
MFLSRGFRKRRRILQWSVELISKSEYCCDRCGGPIHPTYIYLRDVFADKTSLDVYREHGKPDCEDRAY